MFYSLTASSVIEVISSSQKAMLGEDRYTNMPKSRSYICALYYYITYTPVRETASASIRPKPYY